MKEFFADLFSQFSPPLQSPILVMSLILMVILFSPILMKKVKLPSIVGLILSGVIIGPYAFNLLEINSFIEIFSEIGILYIMFWAGLELDLNDFKVNKNKSIVFGIFTFVIPLMIGYPAIHFFLHYDFNSAFLTAAMFATHTLVTYPIVSRLGVSKNEAVAVTVGGTILTDTAVLIILAVIIGNAEGGLSQAFWTQLGISLVIFCLIMFLVIPKIAKWFFLKFEQEKHLHYIFVLAIIFFSAFLATASGLEGIIGAFVAGLAINKQIPASSALMNRVEYMGNALFIPFFLISVGMMMDISVIFHGWNSWIIAGVLTAVAMLGKWLAAFFTQLVFNYSKLQRQIIFGLSSAHAAATLAVVKVGYDKGIMDDAILNGTIILILIACVVASLVTEKAGAKLKEQMETNVDLILESSSASKEKIVLMYLEVEQAEKLLNLAILIRDKSSPNSLALLSVIKNDEEAEANVVKAKAESAKQAKDAPATETEIEIIATIDDSIEAGLKRIARELSADLLLLQWMKGNGAFYLGDQAKRREAFIRATNRNVFLCHLTQPIPLHNKIHIIAPANVKKEEGFSLWVMKMALLAKETSNQVKVYADAATHEGIKTIAKENKLSSVFDYVVFTELEDFLILSKFIEDRDLIILISARRGAVSYSKELNSIPAKIEKHFSKNSFIVIYPKQSNFKNPEISETKKEAPPEKPHRSLGKLRIRLRDIWRP